MEDHQKEVIRKEIIDEMKAESIDEEKKERENVRKSIEWPRTEQIIGKGNFGQVVKAKYFGTPVAVKKATGTSRFATYVNEQNITEEITRMSQLHHPNIVSMIANTGTMIIMELYDGSLRVIRDYGEMAFVTRECLRGIAYLQGHRQCMFHGDIKPDNIMVGLGQDGRIARVALGDFGVSKECTVRGDFSGTPGYMPESQGSNINSLTDIFALAVSVMDAYFEASVHTKYGGRLTDNTMDHASRLPEDIGNVISQMLVAFRNDMLYKTNPLRKLYVKTLQNEWDILFDKYFPKPTMATDVGLTSDNFYTANQTGISTRQTAIEV